MKGKQITPNFNEDEFRCKGKNCCGGQVVIDYDLVFGLQKLRDYIREKTGNEHEFIVTCGYRCPKHNREIGGAPASAHLSGKAIDFYVKGLTIAQVWLFIEKMGVNNFSGMGSYPEEHPPILHCDNLPSRYNRWCRRGGKYWYLF